MIPPFERVTLIWRVWALGLVLGVAALLTAALAASDEPVTKAVRATAPAQAFEVYRGPASTDSLGPMIAAYYREATVPKGDLYSVFFADKVKFQYPPSSLLIFDPLPRSWTIADGKITKPLRRFWTLLCYLSMLLTVLTTAAILEVRTARLEGREGPALSDRRIWCGAALSLALGLTFYPLVKGYDLGQIQVFLGCLVAFALLFHVLGRTALAGAFLGACCLIKPQWGVVLVWALVRRQKRFAAAFLMVFLAGTALSLLRYGLADNLRYLDVLRAIGGTGEVFWPNQSVNGLLNRILGNGSPTEWTLNSFAAPDPFVRIVTLLTSLALLGFALWPQGKTARAGADLPLALVAATIASPVAWEHHYGAFLPILAASVPDLARVRPLGRATAPVLAFSYVAMASIFLRPELLFANRAIGLLGSHVFFGGLALYFSLVALRRTEAQAPAPLT
jgi:hypothetical protein